MGNAVRCCNVPRQQGCRRIFNADYVLYRRYGLHGWAFNYYHKTQKMITVLTFVIVFIIAVFSLGLYRKSGYFTQPKSAGAGFPLDNPSIKPAGVMKLVLAFIGSWVLAFLNPLEIERIDTGHVGLIVDQTGQDSADSGIEYARGWQPYNSWTQRVYEFPVFQQHIDYEEAVVITKGGFQATIKPSFNYSLNSGSVDNMFQNLRVSIKEVEQGWLKNAIVSSVNDVANLFTVDSIFNHRAEFEAAIVKECNKRVSRWFTVSQLRTNIIPPPEISQSIIAKTKAIQEAQVAENQRIVAMAEAERKMATARGDSAQAVIEAAGRAEAIRREQLSLTPLYIEYIKATRWNGHLSQVVAGNGGMILDLSDLNKK
jgi:hypothetical protein